MSTKPEKPSFYLTTPIYYVNSVPHLGTAYTTIAADAMARYRRMTGYDVWFLTGLDEHGQKVEQAATAAGVTPREWVDRLAGEFQETWRMLSISNDQFIRTTDPTHTHAVQELARRLYESGDIYAGTYEGWYCLPDETYWAEANLEPANEAGERMCPDCTRPLTFVTEENYFFKLSKYTDKLLEWYDSTSDGLAHVAPETRMNEVRSFVERGLDDISISRSNVKWGIPLPWDESHTMYVWFDALINYISAIGYGTDKNAADAEARAAEFAHRWPAQLHYVGKDIIRFHCIIWPALLMAAGLELPQRVFAHGFLLTKGEKMSKSKGNAQTPAELVEQFGVDGYRYYFLRDVQFGTDGSISHEAMVQRYNGDLANDWGNLCSRLFNMVGKYCDGAVPDASGYADAAEGAELREIAAGLGAMVEERMVKLDYAGALEATWELIKATNRYLEESAPWALAKDDATLPRLYAVLYNALETVRIAALYCAPVMPNTSAQVFERLSLGDIWAVDDLAAATQWGQLPVGNTVTKGDSLFPRIATE
ncbi:MAG: methionine--tRNA ligase [Coriobacteriia bacterium]|nr:methionine--tRNA ligase [Coriobacteriia bacterium]